MEIEVKNLSLKVMNKRNEHATILNDVNAVFKPGRLNVLIGASGSGKTSLLNIVSMRPLSNRIGTVKVYGSMLINGEPMPSISKYLKLVSYVQQHDILMETATVYESIMFVLKLKSSSGNSEIDKERVLKVLKELSLDHRSDYYVGSSQRDSKKVLSGGEMKRVSIAQELVCNNSKILALDEPTSGLDSSSAVSVMKLLSRLSKENNRTILASIHQPSSTISRLFDTLTILADGKCLYCGDWLSSIKAFEQMGYPIPPLTNPTDYFIECATNPDDKENIINKWKTMNIKYYTNEEINNESLREKIFDKDMLGSSIAIRDSSELKFATFWEQVRLLTIRGFKHWIRSPVLFFSEFLNYLINGVFISVLFLTMSSDIIDGVFDRRASLYFLLLCLCYIPSFTSLDTASTERPLVERESNSGLYTVGAHLISKTLCLLPFEIFFSLVFVIITYLVMGYHSSAKSFFLHYLVVIIFVLTSETIGFLISHLTSDSTAGILITSSTLLVCSSLGGFIVGSGPREWYAWTDKINYFSYAYNSLILIEFNDITLTGENNQIITGQEILNSTRILKNDLSLGENILIMICILIIIRGATYVFIIYQNKSSATKLIQPDIKSQPVSKDIPSMQVVTA